MLATPVDLWIYKNIPTTKIQSVLLAIIAGLIGMFVVIIIAAQLILACYVIINWTYPVINNSTWNYLLVNGIVYTISLGSVMISTALLSKILIENILDKLEERVRQWSYKKQRSKLSHEELLDIAMKRFVKSLVLGDVTDPNFVNNVLEVKRRRELAIEQLVGFPEALALLDNGIKMKARDSYSSNTFRDLKIAAAFVEKLAE